MVQRLKITHFYTAPTAIRMLIKKGDEWVKKYDRSTLRILGCGKKHILMLRNEILLHCVTFHSLLNLGLVLSLTRFKCLRIYSVEEVGLGTAHSCTMSRMSSGYHLRSCTVTQMLLCY